MQKMIWPNNKKFAFTIFDDTDHATVENVSLIYDFLKDLGFRTTKSVWPIKGVQKPKIGGDTCENPQYLKWIYGLQKDGFEIGLHNVTYHTSERADSIRGIERFKELFGDYPKTMANHSGCKESIYWGSFRVGGIAQFVYLLGNLFRGYNTYRGHIQGDSLFWGDICQERIKYVRNFVYDEINTLKICPQMPYHDPKRSYVQNWFAATEGQTIDLFLRSCSEKNIARLEEEGGACIMYTHLAKGFSENGLLNEEFRKVMESLSSKNGWFVPVGELLDYIKMQRGDYEISNLDRNRLEWNWLLYKMKVGHS
jgi:hypothetical protein